MDAVADIRPGTAEVCIGDSVGARGRVYTVADIANDACGNSRPVLKR